MYFPKAPLTALSVATLVAIVGCGGSSGSDKKEPDPIMPGPGPDPIDTTGLEVTGEAIKGVLKNAQVAVYELNDQGERLEGIIAEPTTTNEQGEYTLELRSNYTGGLLEVVVSAGDNTTMICDASRCGEVQRGQEVPVTGDFSLTSIIENDGEGLTVSAPVTAWSTMAANRAKALLAEGGKSNLREARRQANSEVRQVVGFNFEEVRARGVSQLEGSNDNETQYALMNAAVAEIVFRDSGQDLSEQLQQFTAALNDGRLGDADDGFSSIELGQALGNAIAANADKISAQVSDALANQAARLESAGDEGFEPDYDEDLDLDESADDAERIAAYKTFMGQTRTWLSSIGELSSEQLLGAVTIDEETLRATVDSNTQARFQFLGEVVGQVASFSAENLSTLVGHLESGGNETIDIKDAAGNTVGQAELSFADNNGLTITASGTATGADGGAFVPFELTLATSIPADSIEIEHADNDIQAVRFTRLLSDNTLSVNATVGDANSEHYLQLNGAELSVAMSSGLESNASGEFDADEIQARLQSASFAGQVAINSGGYRFDGDASFELVRLNDGARLYAGTELEGDVLAPKKARLSGEFTSADNATRFSAVVSANIYNAAAFDTFNWLSTRGNLVHFSGLLDQDAAESVVAQSYPEETVRPDYVSLVIWQGRTFYNSSFFRESPNDLYAVRLSSDNTGDTFDPNEAILSSISDDFLVKLEAREEHVYDEATDTYDIIPGQTATLTGADILSSAQVDLALLYSDIEERPDEIQLSYQTSVDFDVEWSDASSDYYDDISAAHHDNELTVILSLPSAPGETLVEVASGFQNDLIELGHVRELGIYDRSSYWNLSLDVPRTETAYDYCVSNPDVFFSYSVSNAASECAWELLDNESEGRDLNQTEQDLLLSIIEAQLADSFIADLDYTVNTAALAVYNDPTLEPHWNAVLELKDPESADYYLQGSLTASLGLTLPELPEAQLTTTLNRTGIDAGSIRANVDWDGGNYTLEVSGESLDNPEGLIVRFYNAQGYELYLDVVFNADEVHHISGVASIDGKPVGEVEWRDGQPVLVFQDGDTTDIQSLF